MGHIVDTAADGAQAVAAARAKSYDIILMDIQMPVLDGRDATRAIRALPGEAGHVPVIALTADVIAAHRSEYLAAGVNAIVAKPINWTELGDEIERQLGEVSANPPPIEPSAAHQPDWAKAPDLDEGAVGMLAGALGEDTLAPMLQTFGQNMIKYRDELGAAVTAADLKQAKRIAHALKGLCAQFGAQRASLLAAFIEVDAKNLADVAPLLPDLAQAITRAKQALAARKPRPGPPIKASKVS